MPFDTAQPFSAKRDIETGPRPTYGWRCFECNVGCMLCDLNDDMLCSACGEPDEDPDSVYDPSPAAMLRAHSTWSV